MSTITDEQVASRRIMISQGVYDNLRDLVISFAESQTEQEKAMKPASGDLLKDGDGLLSPRLIHDGESPNPIPWADPTPEMLTSPEFEAVWQCIKKWDINVPDAYAGYCGATGNHVRAILNAITAAAQAGKESDVHSRGMGETKLGQRSVDLATGTTDNAGASIQGAVSDGIAARQSSSREIPGEVRAVERQPDNILSPAPDTLGRADDGWQLVPKELLAALKLTYLESGTFDNFECSFGPTLGTCPISNNCIECEVHRFFTALAASPSPSPPSQSGEGQDDQSRASLLNIRDHLKRGVCGQREVWVRELTEAADRIATLTKAAASAQHGEQTWKSAHTDASRVAELSEIRANQAEAELAEAEKVIEFYALPTRYNYDTDCCPDDGNPGLKVFKDGILGDEGSRARAFAGRNKTRGGAG